MEIRSLLVVLIHFFCQNTIQAQFKEIALKDWNHALYDVSCVNDSSLFCVGENDEAFIININSGEKRHFTTNSKIAWLHILHSNADSALVIGDHESVGWFYFKDLKNKIYASNSNKAYYAGVKIADRLIAAGGKSSVANGIKQLPNGFVTQFSNGIVRKIRRPFRFFFHTYNINNKAYTIGYNAFNSKLFEIKKAGLRTVKKFPYLIHRIVPDANSILLCGTTTYKRRHALIIENEQTYLFENKDVVWDIKRVGNYLIGAGSNGLIYSKKDGANTFTILNTNYNGHYYRIVPISNSTYAAVGQNGRVILATLSP